MSLKVLAGRIKRPEAKPAVEAVELDRARREATAARGQTEAARKEAAEAQKRADEARAALERQTLDSTIAGSAAKARALNPTHVVALTRDRFEIVDGKVRPKDKPDADVDTYMTEWLGSEGKHFLPAQVPGGGAGAPGTVAAPKMGTPHDMTTDAGLTGYARDRVKSARERQTAAR
ncbi:MAG: hypothetical protein IPQ07_38040 [Myxococcales bacterium]|nr:hypothetical protein [Myxococcales bacterium]